MAGLGKFQVQLGDSATATQNFVLTSAAADGTMKLARGNYGATTQDIMTVASDGNAQLTKTTSQSMVKVTITTASAAGYGSTNLKIRRWANGTNGVNGCIIQGTDITYADSATNGGTFTINTNGVYAISYCDNFAGGGGIIFGLTKNTATPTSTISACALPEILAVTSQAGNPNYIATIGWTGYLTVGDIIRAHTDGTWSGTQAAYGAMLTITRVS